MTGFPFVDSGLASHRSAGRQVRFREALYTVEALEKGGDAPVDLAFFSAGGAVSEMWGPQVAQRGALVIDNSNAFRMRDDVPLIVPQVNAENLAHRPAGNIVGNPNCSTIQLVRVLKPLARAFSIERVILTTYQAASGVGRSGIQELFQRSKSIVDGTPEAKYERFPVPLAFNVIPQVGEISEDGAALEERKLINESRKILNLPTLKLSATCVRVPVVSGHSEAVYVEFGRAADRAQVEDALLEEGGIRLYRHRQQTPYPTPRQLENRGDVHVGRVRIDPCNSRGVWLWVVADNLQVGAALNALQIAKLALTNGLVEMR